MKAELAELAAALGGGVFTDPGAAAAEVAAQLDHAEERLATLRVRSTLQRIPSMNNACVDESAVESGAWALQRVDHTLCGCSWGFSNNLTFPGEAGCYYMTYMQPLRMLTSCKELAIKKNGCRVQGHTGACMGRPRSA